MNIKPTAPLLNRAAVRLPKPAQSEAVQLPNGETVDWGDFARGRHKPGTGYSYFQGSQAELLGLVQQNWEQRKPGVGRSNLDEVVVVPMPSARFLTTTIAVEDTTALQAQNFRRRDHEDAYLRVTSQGQPQPSNFAQVVLYSRETLGKNDERSSFSDWEIVTQYAGR